MGLVTLLRSDVSKQRLLSTNKNIFYLVAKEEISKVYFEYGEDAFTAYGYEEDKRKRYLCYVSFILTAGFSFMAFHWNPHWWVYCR